MDIYMGSVFLAAVAGFVIGFLWYMPQTFGKAWMKAVGLEEKDMSKEGMGSKMALSFLSTLVLAWVLAHFVEAMLLWKESAYDVVDPLTVGAYTGFLAWLGFLATSLIDPVLWMNKPWSLWRINAGQWLVKLVVMGMILGAW